MNLHPTTNLCLKLLFFVNTFFTIFNAPVPVFMLDMT